jgi:hypothetical protein
MRQPTRDLIVELLARASWLEQQRVAAEQRATAMEHHSAPPPMRQLTTTAGHVDIEVVQALDGWPAR